MEPKIKFLAVAVKWFDKVNGNTYHSVKVTRTRDGAVLACPYSYGYGDQYRQTALDAMFQAGWLPKKYNKDTIYLYERENNYPVSWEVHHGLKRDCIKNGTAK
jgi:hypothetical protein